MLLLLLQNQKPTHIAVAFDVSRHSFRTDEYPEYKGTRGETPPEFQGQIPLIQESLTAMGIPILTKEGIEADDILATLAKRGEAEGYKVYLVSGDRDVLQMVNDDVTLLYPNARGVTELKVYDPAAVRERYGLEPEQYPDVAALVGETSDNLIGIDKVGEKTAVKWINQYGEPRRAAGARGRDHRRGGAEPAGPAGSRGPQPQAQPAAHGCRTRSTARQTSRGPPLDEELVRELFDRLQFRTLIDRIAKMAAAERGDKGGGTTAPLGVDASLPPVDRAVRHCARRVARTSALTRARRRSRCGRPPSTAR